RYIVTLPTVPNSFFGIPLDFGGSPTQNGYGFPIVTAGQIFQESPVIEMLPFIIALFSPGPRPSENDPVYGLQCSCFG
ncbi:MAG: hypothetical protein M1368_00590, partial [Thaumarchaeota archaeon]|nr:hypothetical protein [Nitrososphaerota archaeon]